MLHSLSHPVCLKENQAKEAAKEEAGVRMCSATLWQDEWLDSSMGRCMIEKDVKDKPSGVSCGLLYTCWPYKSQAEAALESSLQFREVFRRLKKSQRLLCNSHLG